MNIDACSVIYYKILIYFTLYYNHNAIFCNSIRQCVHYNIIYLYSDWYKYISFDPKPGMTFHSPLKYITLLYFYTLIQRVCLQHVMIWIDVFSEIYFVDTDH